MEARLFARVLVISVYTDRCTRCFVYRVHKVECNLQESRGRGGWDLDPRGDIDIEFPASRRSVLNRSISRIRVN